MTDPINIPDPALAEALEQAAPSLGGGRTCRKCGRTVTVSGDHCPKPCGGWLVANTGALVHGGRSRQVAAGQLPEQAEALAAIAEREGVIVGELGGPDAVSQIKRDLVTRYLETSTIADYLAENIVRNGVLTTKGRTRAAVSTYLQVIDRLHRLGVSIGLERRQRSVPSAAEYWRQRETGASTDAT